MLNQRLRRTVQAPRQPLYRQSEAFITQDAPQLDIVKDLQILNTKWVLKLISNRSYRLPLAWPRTAIESSALQCFLVPTESNHLRGFGLRSMGNKRLHAKCGMGTRLPLGDGRKCRLSFLCIPVTVCFLEDLAILFANIGHFAFVGGDGKSSFCLD